MPADDSANISPVRLASMADAPELARLLTVLGHATSAESITGAWSAWTSEGNSAYVIERAGHRLAGLITLHHMLVLHRPRPVGRITSLVVDEDLRGRGIGATLVAAAEAELRRLGCGLLEVTSNNRRVEAHAFYERLGYERTSVRLSKTLNA